MLFLPEGAYKMYHSITLDLYAERGGRVQKINTYDDLHLIPLSRPVINPPAVKTKQIDVPGANGVIDLTGSLTPYPVYSNRQGSISFAVENDKENWQYLYSRILNLIHGHKAETTLEDDPGWIYDGRWTVSGWNSNNNGTWSEVTLDYDLAPYKLGNNSLSGAADTGLDRWLWDPFSFYDGVIYKSLQANGWSAGTAASLFKDIPVNSTDWVNYGILRYNGTTMMGREVIGWMPVSPTIIVDRAGIGIRITNQELGYRYEKVYDAPGEYSDPYCILYDYSGDGFHIYFKGTGNVSVSFRRGSL